MAVVYFPGDLLYQMHGLTEALLGIYRLVGHWGSTQVFHHTFSVIQIKLKAINYNESLLSVPRLAHVFSCSATILNLWYLAYGVNKLFSHNPLG